ncbi:unnamed protein product [Cylindrotheca closterium]|uniref:Uncharacterized protein n=1 Tax=Cylindrotheca closterium TaxID=2856 RepID=A0AAD2FTA5_9STRA|nr:unnamed protein product [Cylindrotheca closterium]
MKGIVIFNMMLLKPSLSFHHGINDIFYRRYDGLRHDVNRRKDFLMETSHLSLALSSHKTQSLGISVRGGDDGNHNKDSSTRKDDDDEECLDNFELEKQDHTDRLQPDFGGTVAGLFGNLRIPASLIAGASLGSAFGLPLMEGEGLVLGMVKRVYTVIMLGSLCSMLLTVLVSTLCMNDIALSPPKASNSAKDFMDRYYPLEWMLARTNFLWGGVIFVIGSMLRGWVFLTCPTVGRGLLGMMGSFTLIATSIVMQFSKQQTGRTPLQSIRRSFQLIQNKMKKSYVFAAGTFLCVFTVFYFLVTIPHIAKYLIASDCTSTGSWWG